MDAAACSSVRSYRSSSIVAMMKNASGQGLSLSANRVVFRRSRRRRGRQRWSELESVSCPSGRILLPLHPDARW